ncbi:PREDICTED: cell cycle checkpoint control protein RAD9B [Tinamus guttatus]|uniref:cell cycle checkpoint control protein RAD9B n=1 Tax=Tinamus guttatus TaxID=94827 RepID=UPI00052EB38B|nr:PREDICTED: cell cycle checkpoint control protein RAD9B [Tinamus guttatus]
MKCVIGGGHLRGTGAPGRGGTARTGRSARGGAAPESWDEAASGQGGCGHAARAAHSEVHALPPSEMFGRAIHAIARISDEFCFDPVEKGLALRSVNSSRSACAYIFFSSVFFQHYCWAAVSESCQKEKQLPLPCKLIIKSVLPVFRCVNMLERNVEKCNIYTNIHDHHITFQLICKHGVVKTHNLTFQECDPLQAVFAKHMCPNVLKLQSRLLADIMIHFPMSQEEVTLAVTPMKVCFKSYSEEDTDFSKAMHTEIQLNPDEFDYFQVGVDSEVTFCLKELRGLLAFSEATSTPVSIHFDISGKPIAFSIEDMLLEASFILATLSVVGDEAAPEQPPRFSQRQESLKTCMSKSEKNSTDRDSNSGAIASSKPHWNGNSQKMELAAPRSPLAKQERTTIPKMSNGDTTGIEGATIIEIDDHTMQEMKSTHSDYHKFHSLFFGAVSFKEKDAINDTFHSLATASDTEEDSVPTQRSQVL